MIPALIVLGWFVVLGFALALCWSAKRADEAVEQHEPRSMGDELDAIVIDFPKPRNGGGFVA